MFVGMAKTPERSDLPFVKDELKAIRDLIPSTNVNLQDFKNPTKERIMQALSHCQFVHFACHGQSDFNPSKGALLLEDWRRAPLTVNDIVSLRIPNSRFAYLSACHTAAKTTDVLLLDESINLVSAMQLAGFPSVIGSLWQVEDQPLADIAKGVYKAMLSGGDKFNNERSAEGLHHELRILREQTCIIGGSESKARNDPIVWAPYIHVGI